MYSSIAFLLSEHEGEKREMEKWTRQGKAGGVIVCKMQEAIDRFWTEIEVGDAVG